MLEPKEYLNIQHSKQHKSIRGEVKSIDFQNDGFFIVYIPSLKLSAYGKSLNEAKEMMAKITIPDFCESLMDLPIEKVLIELKSLGWNSNSFFKKELSKSAHVDVEGILREFDLPKETKINESTLSVAA
ncbi:hypothetical protein ACFOWA_19960 [Pedobacter lithocola]|uniref:Uncharacterized protein n=1 Tax=Pedobacter lithocola TaxID=1908239 RepID=A0ABV8PGV2_9SPHI